MGTALLHPAERRRWGRARLLRALADVEASAGRRESAYIPPGIAEPSGVSDSVRRAAALAGESETGLAVFVEDDRVTAVAPPFPLSCETGDAAGALCGLLESRLKIGVALIRLGRYGVGVLDGDRLAGSKTGSRYVKNRHRAGGSSQRRFERSRERLIRELFDKTCEVMRDVFSPHAGSLDYVLLGGDKAVLRQFAARCGYLKEFEDRTLGRRLAAVRPDQRTLDGIGWEVWASRVWRWGQAEAVPD